MENTNNEILKTRIDPIAGDVKIGTMDPKTLDERAFNNSKEILFHGSGKKFEYSHEGVFDLSEVVGDGTTDYGSGFYATQDLDQAKEYSLVRNSNLDEPFVQKLLPFDARMLDVRTVDGKSSGSLPAIFVQEWLSYLKKYISNNKNFENMSGFLKETVINGIQSRFIDRVQKAFDADDQIVIREGNGKTGIFFYGENGLIDTAFRDYMLQKGYDGMIHLESGEGKNRYDFTSYVFYNPAVIDTYEGWKKRSELK